MTIMLTLGEQQEVRQVEQELRDADRGFGWRLTMFQGMLAARRSAGVSAGPGHAGGVLLRLVAAAGRC